MRPPAASYAPGREALQALLAFSSLHQQIRERRARQIRDGAGPDNAEIWGPEQFVFDEVLQLVSERALAITGTDGVAIALAEGDEIRCRASAGRIAPDAGARLDPTSGFSGACLRTGLIVRCDDSEKDPRVDREACRLLGLHSIVAVPLMTERGVIGLLAAFCSEPYGFNDSDVRSLSLLAELILAAMKPEEDARATQASAPKAGEARRTIPPPVMEASKIGAAKVEVSKPQALKVEALKIELPSIQAQKIQTPKAQTPAPQPEPTQVPEAPTAQITAAPEVQLPELHIPELQISEVHVEEPGPDGLPNMQSLREALARVTEESGQLPAPEPLQVPESFPTFPFSQSAEPQNSKRGLAMAMAFLFLLIALALTGGTLWWRQQHRGRQAAAAAIPQQTGPDASSNSAEASLPPAASENNTASPGQKAASSELTGVRHWSSLDSSTVAIDLQDQVQYEAHRLTNPERIYFDLHDTTLTEGLLRDIEVGDALLVRIRVAQPTPDVTRVVLETKDSPNFSVSMETNPYRLVVEIRSVGAKPKASKLDLFAPMNPDGSGQRASVNALPGTWLQPQTASNAENTQPRAHSAKFSIVLDAGHGGWDMGTVGRKGLLEKNLVLDIVARLGSMVSNRLGAEVIYTRRDDSYVSLEQRTETANLSQADMFLSVHGNYSDLPSARGVETYYTNTFSSAHAKTPDGGSAEDLNVALTNVDVRGKVQQSRVFAERVQQALYHALLKKDPAVRDRGVREASYVVLTGTTMPAVLAEVSFVSSPTDEARLENPAYRQQIAEALYKGVATYAEGSHRVNMASAAARPAGQ
jgi:N-acetylmuramoyl-L-alanine amidase